MRVALKKFAKNLAHLVLQGGHAGPAPVKVLGGRLKGVRLNLDLRTQGSYWLGTYDDWILKRVPLRLLIREGHTAWDGGAFVGFYTALLRLRVGMSGQVHAFEASPLNFRAVAGIADLNDWSNVRFHDVAIGPDHSKITFAAEDGGASGPVGLVDGTRAGISRGLVTVRSCGVDELIEERGIPAPDFMKFDLETGEIFALANGAHLFESRRPILMLELHGRECLAAALRFARQFDYHLTDIWVLPDRGDDAALMDPGGWGAAYRAASDEFLAAPPHERPPHMTLAIARDRLEGLSSRPARG